jgi:hypothetical protein
MGQDFVGSGGPRENNRHSQSEATRLDKFFTGFSFDLGIASAVYHLTQ